MNKLTSNDEWKMQNARFNLTTSLPAVELKQSDAKEKAWSHSKRNYGKGVLTVIKINANPSPRLPKK